MDPLILFVCIFLPTFGLSMLSASRDQILFQTRPATRTSVVLVLTLGGAAFAHWLGMPWSWALSLTFSGMIGSGLGDWLGRGGWVIVRFHVDRLLGRA